MVLLLRCSEDRVEWSQKLALGCFSCILVLSQFVQRMVLLLRCSEDRVEWSQKLALGCFFILVLSQFVQRMVLLLRCSEDRVEWSQKLALGCFLVYFGSFSVCPADGVTASLLSGLSWMEPETSSRLFFRVFWFFLSLSSGWCYCLAALRIELSGARN